MIQLLASSKVSPLSVYGLYTTNFALTVSQSAPILKPATRPSEAVYNAFRYESRLQTKAGCWGTDMSCIQFVTPMCVFAWYITGTRIPESHAIEVASHLLKIQDPEDGGWSTHQGAKTTLFGTAVVYVALRLMGFPQEHEQLIKARRCLLRMGGAVLLPSWAKFWLCLLGLYEWSGTDPYPVEMWWANVWLCAQSLHG